MGDVIENEIGHETYSRRDPNQRQNGVALSMISTNV